MKRSLFFELKHNVLYALLLFTSFSLNAQVSGTVWQDLPVNGTTLNTYGVKDANELGVEGVTVTVYPGGMTATTAADGTYTVAGASGAVRVEFTWPTMTWLQSSPDAAMQNTSVQFVTVPATGVDFGLHNPNDYSNTATPPFAENINTAGTGIGNNLLGLVTAQYLDQGLNSDFSNYNSNSGTGPTPTVDATVTEIGTVWGKGYRMSDKKMFISTVLMRHAGFANGNPSRIYVADYTASPGNVLGGFDLQGVLPANGGGAIDLGSVTRSGGSDYVLYDDPTSPTVDLDAYGKIAKMSYGDLDFDNNTQTIWAVNLFQRAIISVDASGDLPSLPGTVNQYLIDGLPGAPSCSNGVLRPWGLGIQNGRGYLGAVCDASSSGDYHDLVAYVLSFDLSNPAAGFTTELTINLDYDRSLDDGYSENPNWYAWSDVVQNTAAQGWDGYNQPVLSDIDFDASGNMYLAFLDRYALQIGYLNYTAVSGSTSITEKAYGQGELFKVCNNGGNFELEGTGSCPAGTTPDGDFFDDRGGDNNAHGASGGSMVLLKGSNQVLVHVNDPHPSGLYGSDYWTTNGMELFSTIDGSIDNWYAFYNSGSIEYTGKGSGMGDVEFLSGTPPVEIGNLVWEDTDGDGIQDAGEMGIQGVIVKLFKADGTTLLETATTDANGNYIFSSATGTSTSSHRYGIAMLMPNQGYIVRIENASGGSQQAAIPGAASMPNTGEGANTDINDSDGIASGTNLDAVVAAADLPVSGANNHTFDFGFSTNACPPARCGTVTAVKN